MPSRAKVPNHRAMARLKVKLMASVGVMTRNTSRPHAASCARRSRSSTARNSAGDPLSPPAALHCVHELLANVRESIVESGLLAVGNRRPTWESQKARDGERGEDCGKPVYAIAPRRWRRPSSTRAIPRPTANDTAWIRQ